jgi:pantoate--beta-alanine ligase
MQVFETAAGFTGALEVARATGRSVGLVPTMGALHAGHESLMAEAAAACDHVAVTIFVNPLQFTDPEDISRYPRTLPADLERCETAGVSSVLVPSVRAMYPDWPDRVATTVSVRGVSERWEGGVRPGHFEGVATVVAKLFSMAGRCRAYFGEKDFQQLAVIRRMVADLSMPVEVVGCPTVREGDGLALSSRNVLLSPPQRRAAPVLGRSLAAGREAIMAGEDRPDAVAAVMAGVVEAEPLADLEYASVVDAGDLTVPSVLDGTVPLRRLGAGRVGAGHRLAHCAAPGPAPGPGPRRTPALSSSRNPTSD